MSASSRRRDRDRGYRRSSLGYSGGSSSIGGGGGSSARDIVDPLSSSSALSHRSMGVLPTTTTSEYRSHLHSNPISTSSPISAGFDKSYVATASRAYLPREYGGDGIGSSATQTLGRGFGSASAYSSPAKSAVIAAGGGGGGSLGMPATSARLASSRAYGSDIGADPSIDAMLAMVGITPSTAVATSATAAAANVTPTRYKLCIVLKSFFSPPCCKCLKT